MLRESAALAGNDHRLGANEAPPAIISVFLGEQLEDVIDQLCATGEATHSKKGGTLKTGVHTIPAFEKDATDRNRTSPFAFTSNKFEFRMIGASDSIASANIVLNTIVAESFKEAADYLEAAEDFFTGTHDLIKSLFIKHRRIIFNGNGYAREWEEEAKKRGLPNIRSAVEAISALTTDKTVKLFEEFQVFTRAELSSRQEIEYENYAKTIHIEARAMLDMAGKSIIPAIIRYLSDLSASLNGVRLACPEADVSSQQELIHICSDLLVRARTSYKELEEVTAKASSIVSGKERARFYYESVIPQMS